MTPPAVKLDENLAQSHVELLRAAGYPADRVTDQGLSGAADPAVWERVQAEHRFFVTLISPTCGSIGQDHTRACFCCGRA